MADELSEIAEQLSKYADIFKKSVGDFSKFA